MSGIFTISLDFELLWGVRDHADKETYGRNILGARDAIPRILDIFDHYGIRATWATVGFLFCESRDELYETLPPSELRPRYESKRLSNYAYLDEIGRDEKADPYYFGASLVDRIRDVPGQELGTHTFSHYYCLEDGATDAALDADLTAAVLLAARRNLKLRSIVFPRNQYATRHLDICKRNGLTAFRGTPMQWVYRPAPSAGQSAVRRALRLLDAHTNCFGSKSFSVDNDTLTNVPASQFLRPHAGRLSVIHPMHLRAIRSGMSSAAHAGRGYHLWWHPHNFGWNLNENLQGLIGIAEHFRHLRDETGMVTHNMGEIAA